MRLSRGEVRLGYAAVAAALLALSVLPAGFASPAAGSNGAWEQAWGRDVITGGGTGFEICTIAANCKAGSVGELGGQFDRPVDVAVDGSGNVYVADLDNNRIQKFDAAGNFVTTWGRDVHSGGIVEPEVCSFAASCQAGLEGGLGGEFDGLISVATDSSGNVYTFEVTNARVQVFQPDGDFVRAWGKDVVDGGGTGFEVCTDAADCQVGENGGELGGEFFDAGGIGVDAGNTVYVADYNNHRVQKFTSTGDFLRTWGRDVDTGGGAGAEACTVAANCQQGDSGVLGGEVGLPIDLGVGADGNVYVTEDLNTRAQRFNSVGGFQLTWGKDVVSGGGEGFEICTVAATCKEAQTSGVLGGEIRAPLGIAADASYAYVAAEGNERIEVFDLSGNWVLAWGKDVVNGGGTGYETCTVASICKQGLTGGLGGELTRPNGLDVDSAGNLFVADTGNERIQKYTTVLAPPPPIDPPEIDTGAPETTLLEAPKPKTKKKVASFSFISSEAGASFECSLDDGPFEPCTSPAEVKVKKGKHSFEVRATDAAGNTDPTPATQSWKVKKKKRQ